MGALLGMSAMDADTVKWTPVLLTQLYNFANATMPRLPMTDWLVCASGTYKYDYHSSCMHSHDFSHLP